MQVSKIKKPQVNLRQGTVITLKGLRLGQSSGVTFRSLYPEVNLKGIGYAIILSQSCDLVKDENRKVQTPYIVLALLEPIERYFKERYLEDKDKLLEKNLIEFPIKNESMRLVNRDGLLKWIRKTFERIFQNNEKFYFFVTLQQGKALRLFTVNLTKMYPLRNEHYDQLCLKAKYQMRPFFENKLGWKLAEIYGRVGTPDYKESEINKLTEKVFDKVNKSFGDFKGIDVNNEDFNKAKNLTNANEDKKEKYFTELIEKRVQIKK